MSYGKIYFYLLAVLPVFILWGCSKDIEQDLSTPSYRIVGKDGKAIYIDRKRPKLNEDYITKKKMEESGSETQNIRKNSRPSNQRKNIVEDANVLSSRNSSAYTTKSVIDDINSNNDLESFAENLKRGKSNKTITDFDYLPSHYFTDDRKSGNTPKETAVIGDHASKNKNSNKVAELAESKAASTDNFMAGDYGVKNLAVEHSIKAIEPVKAKKAMRILAEKKYEAGQTVDTEKTGFRDNKPADNSMAIQNLEAKTTEEVTNLAEAPDRIMYYVQLGMFLDENRANALLDKFKDRLPNLRVEKGTTSGGQAIHKVLVGGFSDKNDLNKIVEQISDMGHREIYVFKK
jgi:cell division septation protein DedD